MAVSDVIGIRSISVDDSGAIVAFLTVHRDGQVMVTRIGHLQVFSNRAPVADLVAELERLLRKYWPDAVLRARLVREVTTLVEDVRDDVGEVSR